MAAMNVRVMFAVVIFICHFLQGQALLFPHGQANGDTVISPNDDGGSGGIQLSTSFPFFDTDYNTLYVNTNGVISFLAGVSQYTPDAFPLSGNRRLIAPFWADVDTRRGGTNSYREIARTSATEALFMDMDTIVRNNFVDQSAFAGISMFIATWDRVAFYGTSNPSIVNTFQAVLVTDGVHSFVLYNYDIINWTTASSSGGSASTGLGGIPAQAGFNAGDGIRFFSIPGSRTSAVVDIETTTNIGTTGRWLFRVDTTAVQNAGCNTEGNLAIYPFVGPMLGGDILRLVGPCFDAGVTYDIKCRFNNNEVVTGEVESSASSRARCVVPSETFLSVGRIPVEMSIDGGANYAFQGFYTLVSVELIAPKVDRINADSWDRSNIDKLDITWPQEIFDTGDDVNIDVVGYHEDGGMPTFETIERINDAPIPYSDLTYEIDKSDLRVDIQVSGADERNVGFIKVSKNSIGTPASSLPTMWSDVHSLHWLFSFASTSSCSTWVANENTTFLSDSPSCPCFLDQAEIDLRFEPLPSCNQDTAPSCDDRQGAVHCVRALQPSASDGGQECCYDNNGRGNILNAEISSGGGFAHRKHHTSSVPYLSHYLIDIEPWTQCCIYGNRCNNNRGYASVRRSQTCDGYMLPQPAGGGGDPHILTFDGTSYTFNGLGEYGLVYADPVSNSAEDDFVLQGRTDVLSQANAFVTVFKAVAARRGTSDVIHVEVNDRRILDVWVRQGQQWTWLDFDVMTWWTFNGVSVSGRNIAESGVLVIFTGGDTIIPLQLKASNGIMFILFLCPESFEGNTMGLFGTCNGNPADDFQPPSGSTISTDASLEVIHNQFGQLWQIEAADSLFYYSEGTSSSTYRDDSFTPIFSFPMNPSVSDEQAAALCGDNEWCLFDFHATGDEEIAIASRTALEEQMAIMEASADVVICSSLESPVSGDLVVTRSSVGGVAMYSCNDGYVIMGLSQRVCQEDGTWFGSAPFCAEEVIIGPSSFMLEMSAYTVLESDGSITLKILRTGDISTEGRVGVITTYTDSAFAGNDYFDVDTTVIFPPDIGSHEVRITIKDDDIREPIENFRVTLYDPEGSDVVMPNMATVFIQDDEVEYSFRELAYTVMESARTVRLNVQKIGYLEQSSVDYIAISDTASSPDDFINRMTSVSFEAGQMQSHIDIDIVDDNDSEGDEQFLVRLQSDDPDEVGQRDTAIVNIEDDDDLCSQPCANEGRCIGVDTCMCSPAHFGDLCQNENCPTGCDNGGTCMAYLTCKCPDGHTGDRCELYVCSPPCENGGICTEGNVCVCPPDFEEDRCEKFVCSPSSCLNGGVCGAGNQCICPAGFTGNQCQINAGGTSVSCSTLSPGFCDGPNLLCRDTANSYVCECAPGYYEAAPRQCILASRTVRVEILIDEIDGVYPIFLEEYYNQASLQYIDLANTIRNVLLGIMRSAVPGFLDVDIIAYTPGSIRVEFDVLIHDASPSGSDIVLQALKDGTDPVSLLLAGSTIRINPFQTTVVNEICPFDYCQNGGTCVPNLVTSASTCQCAPTFSGNQCEEIEEEEAPNEGLSTRDIVGITFGAILVPIVAVSIVLVFCCYIRRRRSLMSLTNSPALSPNWLLGNPLGNTYEIPAISASSPRLESSYPSLYGNELQTLSQYHSWNNHPNGSRVLASRRGYWQ